jgi:hypothetical protein
MPPYSLIVAKDMAQGRQYTHFIVVVLHHKDSNFQQKLLSRQFESKKTPLRNVSLMKS